MSHTLFWYTSRGSGVVSTILLSLVVILGILSYGRWEARDWPRFLVLGLHRNLSLMMVAFILLHVLTAVLDPYAHLGLMAALVPLASRYRPLWVGLGVVAFELVLALVASSLLRPWLGQRTWRGVHWLAYLAWPVSWAHGLGSGSDAHSSWMWLVNGLCLVPIAGALAWRVQARIRRARVEAVTGWSGAG